MASYVFKAEIEQEEGVWTAHIPALPGCAVEGKTRSEAIEALQEVVQAFVEVKREYGDPLPDATLDGVIAIYEFDVVSVIL